MSSTPYIYGRNAPVSPSLIEDAGAMAKRRTAATRLRELWASLVPEGTPDLTTFFDWVDRYGAGVAERGVNRTSEKARMKRRTPGEVPFSAEGAARYASATMRNIAAGTS